MFLLLQDEVRVNDKLEIIKTLLTEEKGTDSWTYHIWTIGDNSSQSNESVPAMYTIRTLKPRGKKQEAEMTAMQEDLFYSRAVYYDAVLESSLLLHVCTVCNDTFCFFIVQMKW